MKTFPLITIVTHLAIVQSVAQQSLSLDDCKKLALEHNYKVRIASEQFGVADAIKSSARTNYFPNISANAIYTRTNKQISLLENDMLIPSIPFSAINPETGQFDPERDPANTFVFNPITGAMLYDKDGNPVFKNYAWLPKDQLNFGSKNIFAGGISLMQPIYTGGKTRETYRMAQHGEKLALANLTKEQHELVFKTEENYWRVVSLQEKVKMVESYLELLEKLGIDLENLYNEGIIIRNDLLRVQVKTNEVKLNHLKAKNGLTLSRMALCQMVGLPLSSDIILTDSLSADIILAQELTYPDNVINNRPEIEALNHAINIAKSGVKLMKSRYMPNIGLTANYMLLNPNPYKGFVEEFGGDWNVGIAINIPIYHWNDKAHTLRAARHGQRIAELQLNEAQELISLQVQQALFTVNESTKKVLMAEENLELAKKNLDVANDAFGVGMVKTTDVLEAQALWQSAWSEFIDARMEYQISLVNMKKVVGEDF